MLNPSDNELDRLSREAAEQYEIDENISSWEKLEQQLDLEIGKESSVSTPGYRGRRFLYTSLLLLLLALIYFLLNPVKNTISHTNKNYPAASSSNTSSSNKQAATKKIAGQDNSGTAITTNKNKPAAYPGSIEEKTKSLETPNDKNLEKKEINTIANTRTGNADNNIDNTRKSNSALAYKKTKGESNIGNGINLNVGNPTDKNLKSYTGKNSGKKNKGQRVASQDKILQPELNETFLNNPDKLLKQKGIPGEIPAKSLEPSAIRGAESLVDNSLLSINDSALRSFTIKTNNTGTGITKPQKKNSQSVHINRPLHIGLMFAPDITNVNSFNKNRVSTNVGITIGYQLFNKWSVNTGLIFTDKEYAAQGHDFTPQNNWINVDGDCEMYEIPLTIRYDFSRGKKTSFFVNGGLSSYLMKGESYGFDYYDNWGYLQHVPKQEYYSGKNNLFTIASLSIGVEKSIGKSFSLQAEPFVKLPFSGVGFGKLQLNSYGISFSLRYNPLLKK